MASCANPSNFAPRGVSENVVASGSISISPNQNNGAGEYRLQQRTFYSIPIGKAAQVFAGGCVTDVIRVEIGAQKIGRLGL